MSLPDCLGRLTFRGGSHPKLAVGAPEASPLEMLLGPTYPVASTSALDDPY